MPEPWPVEVTVNVGDTVIWTSYDSETVTSGDFNDPDTWGIEFESGIIQSGSTFEHIFDTLGEYSWFSQIHPWWIGKVIVVSGGDGELVITLPRDHIDSKLNGDDDEFIIIVDGAETDYQELNTNDMERKLAIPIFAGAEEVEIIGTQVVPEFPLSVLVIMTVVVGMGIAATRFKNPLL